ncbi:pentapeptide repeat-containing protein [Streptosporangium sp. NPDC020072]|uniref:pentapeptide repeat-containing protein n=1 Tax=Streptosporangium sp. NPDC020072 TaxID=3154788 RepID=UPI00341AC3D0
MTVLVAVAVAATLWWLLADPAATVPISNPSTGGAGNARGEVLRTALAAGAAVGAAVTLMLAFRRQHHQEVTAAHTTHDATERRVTDLYTKAVEQLGHEAAAVRLGGLYALERLAQDNPGHRQTIVNVICAYLRMPWVSPDDAQQDLAPAVPRAAIAGASTPATGRNPHEELQVRLTAQRILSEHLRDDRTPDKRTAEPAGPQFWEGMRIDLTGATLTNLNFRNCHVTEADFSNVTFAGRATFFRATFIEVAWFVGATFTGSAEFTRVTFTKNAAFHWAAFTKGADFHQVTFTQAALFFGATFTKRIGFHETTFAENARFDEVTFIEGVDFVDATAVPMDDHVWPDGWHLEMTSDGKGYLVADDASEKA